jgi:pyruvate kinase
VNIIEESIKRRPSQTKIVATIGPACDGVERLGELIAAGVDVFRINTAHGSRQEHEKRLGDVREASRKAGAPVAVLVDLAGPKIRLGELPGGTIQLVAGERVRFVAGTTVSAPGELVTSYAPLVGELRPGDRVVLADGMVALVVEEVDAASATCRIVQSGLVRSRQGVNLPGVKLSVPSMNDRDRDNAAWAAAAGVDFVGLSFVRTSADIDELKAILSQHGSETQVVAKIEKPEAVENLDSIVAAADAIMVARGDLGVEIDIAEVPMVQKRIIRTCHCARKPVIVATQMLDSMQHSRLPTRAEATDVANAILDGADACTLSGETAIGDYPREAVEMMHRIALATESAAQSRLGADPPILTGDGINPITEATTLAAGRIAAQIGARLIVVVSASGRSALSISQYRHRVPVIGISRSEAALRRMSLYWGITAIAGAPAETSGKLLDWVVERGRSTGFLVPGERIVLITGTGAPASRHNAIVVHQL